MKASRILPFAALIAFSAAAPAQTSKHVTQPGATAAQSNEAQIRDLYDRWAKAFRARDLDAIMTMYATGDKVIAYDVVPPLQYRGADAYRKDYQQFIDMFDGPLEVEYRDMRVVAGDRVGFVHALERLGGKLKNGQRMDVWVRATSGVEKINGKWLIVHDHISVPADLDAAKALLNLKP